MIDFNGSPVEVGIAGDRAHYFTMPLDRSTVPAKVLTAFKALEKTRKAHADARAGGDAAAVAAADEALREALSHVYDTAAATSSASREHHQQGYSYEASKVARHLEDLQKALQKMSDHMQQAQHAGGVGFDANTRAVSPEVARLRLISEQLAALPAVPELA